MPGDLSKEMTEQIAGLKKSCGTIREQLTILLRKTDSESNSRAPAWATVGDLLEMGAAQISNVMQPVPSTVFFAKVTLDRVKIWNQRAGRLIEKLNHFSERDELFRTSAQGDTSLLIAKPILKDQITTEIKNRLIAEIDKQLAAEKRDMPIVYSSPVDLTILSSALNMVTQEYGGRSTKHKLRDLIKGVVLKTMHPTLSKFTYEHDLIRLYMQGFSRNVTSIENMANEGLEGPGTVPVQQFVQIKHWKAIPPIHAFYIQGEKETWGADWIHIGAWSLDLKGGTLDPFAIRSVIVEKKRDEAGFDRYKRALLRDEDADFEWDALSNIKLRRTTGKQEMPVGTVSETTEIFKAQKKSVGISTTQ